MGFPFSSSVSKGTPSGHKALADDTVLAQKLPAKSRVAFCRLFQFLAKELGKAKEIQLGNTVEFCL